MLITDDHSSTIVARCSPAPCTECKSVEMQIAKVLASPPRHRRKDQKAVGWGGRIIWRDRGCGGVSPGCHCRPVVILTDADRSALCLISTHWRGSARRQWITVIPAAAAAAACKNSVIDSFRLTDLLRLLSLTSFFTAPHLSVGLGQSLAAALNYSESERAIDKWNDVYLVNMTNSVTWNGIRRARRTCVS